MSQSAQLLTADVKACRPALCPNWVASTKVCDSLHTPAPPLPFPAPSLYRECLNPPVIAVVDSRLEGLQACLVPKLGGEASA